MRGIERRLQNIEDRRRIQAGDYSRLNDVQLERALVQSIERIGEAGAVLPLDWRERCHEDATQLLNDIEKSIGEL